MEGKGETPVLLSDRLTHQLDEVRKGSHEVAKGQNKKSDKDRETIQSSTKPGLDVIKLEFILKLNIKHNDWLLADTCSQAVNHCTLF